MTSLFTQSYRDSGFEGLVPMGVCFCRASGKWEGPQGYPRGTGKGGAIAEVRESLEKQGVQFVFGCTFKFCHDGHPDYNSYDCEVIGDAYKLPPDSEQLFTQEGGVKLEKPVRCLKHKTEWGFRCGLVKLEREAVE